MFRKSSNCVKNILLIVFLAASAGILLQNSFAAAQEIAVLFDKMKRARRTVSYRGEVKIERQARGRVMPIRTGVFANPSRRQYREWLILTPEERERLERLMERARQNITTDRQREMMRHWTPDFQRRISLTEQNFADINIRIDLLQKNYEISIDSGDSIAGRPTDFIAIAPKYEYRPENRLWIDKETGLILKREIFIPENPDAPVYREEFISIELLDPDELTEQQDTTSRRGEITRPDIRTERRRDSDTREYTSLEKVSRWHKSRIKIPSDLPPGFVLDKILITEERRRQYTYHQVYIDGLIMFSLFQQRGRKPPEDPQRPEQREHPQFRAQIYPRGMTELSRYVNGTRFTVRGSAPKELLQPVLDSLPGKESRSR